RTADDPDARSDGGYDRDRAVSADCPNRAVTHLSGGKSKRSAVSLRTKMPRDCLQDMRNALKKQWQSLKRGQPGERFKNRYYLAKNSRKGASFGHQISRVVRFVVALLC